MDERDLLAQEHIQGCAQAAGGSKSSHFDRWCVYPFAGRGGKWHGRNRVGKWVSALGCLGAESKGGTPLFRGVPPFRPGPGSSTRLTPGTIRAYSFVRLAAASDLNSTRIITWHEPMLPAEARTGATDLFKTMDTSAELSEDL